jgi:glycosyl transferase family 87
VLLAVLLFGGYLAAEAGKRWLTGLLIGLAVFVKPYALIFMLWLWFAAGWTGLGVAMATAMVGLAAPALVYGWAGNLEQVHGWYTTVTQTTAPNLLNHDNASFASTWSKWLGVGPRALQWSVVSSAMSVAIVAAALIRRRAVERPLFLEFSALLLLIPLISPQGWVYTLLLGTPAVLLLVDRWSSVPLGSRVLAIAGIGFMSFTIYDLLGRRLYMYAMSLNVIGIAAFVVFLTVIELRFRKVV